LVWLQLATLRKTYSDWCTNQVEAEEKPHFIIHISLYNIVNYYS